MNWLGHWQANFPKGKNKIEEDWNACKAKLPIVDHFIGPMLMKKLCLRNNPMLAAAIAIMIQDYEYSLDELLTCEKDEIRDCALVYAQMQEKHEEQEASRQEEE